MSTEIRVQCDPCGHVWVAAYLPMDMDKFAKLMKAIYCPKCAATSKQIKLSKGLPNE